MSYKLHDGDPCILCGRQATDPHHTVRRWKGKESEGSEVPLCRLCHDAYHRGDPMTMTLLAEVVKWRDSTEIP